MKKILLFAVLLFVAGGSFAQKTETRNVSNFSAIRASSAFTIVVNKGSTESLVIEADDDIMPYVRSEVKEGALRLYLDDHRAIRNVKNLKATVGVKTLNEVKLSGACKLSSDDLFDVSEFEIDLSGACNLKMHIKAQELDVDASGACSIDLKADTDEADFDLSGTSKMQLDLKTIKASFGLSGACKVTVNGSADKVGFGLSGACKINAADFNAKTVDVRGSGATSAEVYATEQLDVKCSGAGTIYYKGRPALSVQTSGASKVKPLD